MHADGDYVRDGDFPVVQETSETVITPSEAKGNNMKTCWICIPLKHIHEEARHTTILNDITSSLETTVNVLAFVGAEKARLVVNGKQQDSWLLLVT